MNRNAKKNILDGDLLYRYVTLGLNEQKHLAQQMGATVVDKIVDDLLEIDCAIDTL